MAALDDLAWLNETTESLAPLTPEGEQMWINRAYSQEYERPGKKLLRRQLDSRFFTRGQGRQFDYNDMLRRRQAIVHDIRAKKNWQLSPHGYVSDRNRTSQIPHHLYYQNDHLNDLQDGNSAYISDLPSWDAQHRTREPMPQTSVPYYRGTSSNITVRPLDFIEHAPSEYGGYYPVVSHHEWSFERAGEWKLPNWQHDRAGYSFAGHQHTEW